MNILLMATFSYAGMGPYVCKIFNEFSHDNVYGFFIDDQQHYYQKNLRPAKPDNIQIVQYDSTKLNKLLLLIDTPHRIKRAFRQFCREKEIDVVHVLASGALHYKMIGEAASTASLLQTVHDLQPHEAKKAWHKMLRQHIIYSKLGRLYSQAPILVTNSHEQYDTLKKLYPSKEIYYHSFPSLVTQEVANGQMEVAEAKDAGPYILFFGRIEKYKGIELLYEAYIQNPYLLDNYKLVIAGSGDVYFDIDRRYADRVVLINRYIDDREIASLYRNAACAVYPYTSATQSGVLSLSCYFQTPSLVSDVPFFAGQVRQAPIADTFANGDAGSLSTALEKLLRQDQAPMRAAQKAYYENEYKEGQIRQQLLSIYGKYQGRH